MFLFLYSFVILKAENKNREETIMKDTYDNVLSDQDEEIVQEEITDIEEPELRQEQVHEDMKEEQEHVMESDIPPIAPPPLEIPHEEEKDNINQEDAQERAELNREQERRDQEKEEAIEEQEFHNQKTQEKEKKSFIAIATGKSIFAWIINHVVNNILHAIRYTLDPIYRNDCRQIAALERRTDLNAQVKAYEDRKAKKINQELDNLDHSNGQVINSPWRDQPVFDRTNDFKERSSAPTLDKQQIKMENPFAETVNNIVSSDSMMDTDKSDGKEKFDLDVTKLVQGEHVNAGIAFLKILQKDPSQIQYLTDDELNSIASSLKVPQARVLDTGDLQPMPRAQIEEALLDKIAKSPNVLQEAFMYGIEEASRAGDAKMEDVLKEVLLNAPGMIDYIPTEYLSNDLVKSAYNGFRAFKEADDQLHYGESKKMDEKAEIRFSKSLMKQHPAIVKAFDQNYQKYKLCVSAAMNVPEALAYMNPKVIDNKTVTILNASIESTNERLIAQGKETIDKNQIIQNIVDLADRGGAIVPLIEKLEEDLGVQLIDHTSVLQQSQEQPMHEDQQYEQSQPEMPPYPMPEPPEELFEGRPDPMDEYEQDQYQEPYQPDDVQVEPVSSMTWLDNPDLQQSIEDTKADLAQINPMLIQNIDPESLKVEMIKKFPDTYKELPDEEKTVEVTVNAVSQNLSLMQYVPDDMDSPNYEDRDILKEKILKAVEDRVVQEAIQTNTQVQYIVSHTYAKEKSSDTLEIKEMKKELKSKSFQLAEQVSKNHDGIEY